MRDADLARATGVAVVAFGPLAIAGVAVPLREAHLATTAVAALLACVVVVVVAIDELASGGVAALVATLSFDFFLSRPYLVLDLDWRDDGRSLVLFAAVALAARAVTSRRRTKRALVATDLGSRGPVARHVQRVMRLLRDGVDGRDLITAVEAELTSLLVLRSCQFERRSGSGRWSQLADVADDDLSQHGERLELPVRAGKHILAVMVLEPTPGARIQANDRDVAYALADLLATGIAPTRLLRPAGPRRVREIECFKR